MIFPPFTSPPVFFSLASFPFSSAALRHYTRAILKDARDASVATGSCYHCHRVRVTRDTATTSSLIDDMDEAHSSPSNLSPVDVTALEREAETVRGRERVRHAGQNITTTNSSGR